MIQERGLERKNSLNNCNGNLFLFIIIQLFCTFSHAAIYLKVLDISSYDAKSSTNCFTLEILEGSSFRLQLCGIERTTRIMGSGLSNAPEDGKKKANF